VAAKDWASLLFRHVIIVGSFSIQRSFSRIGIDAKDFEVQPQANLDVFGVYADNQV